MAHILRIKSGTDYTKNNNQSHRRYANRLGGEKVEDSGEKSSRYSKYTLFTFTVFSGICYFILHRLPLAVDDFGFQQIEFNTFSDVLRFALGYGNGRLLGNSGIIFLTHHLFIADVLRAIMLSGIAILLPTVLQLKNRVLPWLSMLLILTISPGVFGQTYSWMSGFQNYVPPVFLFLCGLWLAERAGVCASRTVKIIISLLCFVCSISMQLYIEHSTCINLLLSTFVLGTVWKNIKWKPYRLASTLFFVGAVLGFVIMGTVTLLSNEKLQEGTVGHASYLFSGFLALGYGIARNGSFLLGMFSENAVMLFLLSVLLTVQIQRNKTAFSDRRIHLYYLCIVLPTVAFLFQLAVGLHPWYGRLAVCESAWILLAWIVYIFAYVISWRKLLSVNEKNEKLRLAAWLSYAAGFGMIPLLFIWPIGYRCLFHSGVALIGAVLTLADDILLELRPEKHRIVRIALASVLAVTVICEGMIFTDIRRMVSIRDAYVEEQARLGADTAAFFLIPSSYIYENWNEETEHYRTIDGHQIRLRILPADVWFRMYYYHYT